MARMVHSNWLSKFGLTFPVAMDLEKNALLTVIRENKLNIQVTDARKLLMQCVHAHFVQSPQHDCLHFFMNSSAINIYLDMYWAQVFSQYTKRA